MPEPFPTRLTVFGAAVAAGALTVRALARPLTTSERRMLDWETVRRTAYARCGEPEGAAPPREVAAALGRRYDAIAADLLPAMAEVVGPVPAHLPSFTVIGRRQFVDENLAILARLLQPVERLRARIPETPLTAIGRAGLSRYLGGLLGLLSRRVLGQYDPVLLVAGAEGDAGSAETTALYLVEPNVVAFERRHAIDGDAVRRWLVLHEVTHAWQFEAHPWLREYLGSLLGDLLLGDLLERLVAEAESRSRRRSVPQTTLLRAVPETVRAQLRAVGRLQAVMSVVEGHGNFVMRRVGREHVPHFAAIDRAFEERARQRPLVERLVYAVTGLRLKLQQYELGERFAEAVVAAGGLSLLDRVWEGPEAMPTLAELRAPQRWIARMHRP